MYNKFINKFLFYDEKPLGVIKYIEEINNKIIVYLELTEFTKQYNNKKEIVLNKSYINIMNDELAKRDERINIINKRGINNLVHFTRLENLDSILEKGIQSIEQLNKNKIDYIYSDENRLDFLPNYISTSIEFPNYKMFYSKRMEDSKNEWVVISITPAIMVHKINSTIFTPCNAASNCIVKPLEMTSNKNLVDMFYKENRINIPDNYTTDPQAEVLIKKDIKRPYMLKISTKKDSDKARSLANNVGIYYENNSELFNGRCDYNIWR